MENIQALSTESYQLTPEISWSNVTSQNFEEAISLIVDTFAENPGNPIFKALGVTKPELDKIWRPKLLNLIKKSKNLETRLFQMIFYYKGIPAGFFFANELHDEAISDSQHKHLDEKYAWKLKIDKLMIDLALTKFPQRGTFLHGWMGVNSITGYTGMTRVMDLEVRLQACAHGWQFVGSNTYNPRTVSITQRNSGQVLGGDIDVSNLEFQGKNVFKEYKETISVCHIIIPVDEETNQNLYPQLQSRYKQIIETKSNNKMISTVAPKL